MLLPYELIIQIFKYLPNEDILKLNKLCKYIKEYTNNKMFINEILYRKHPLVFNQIDNYCNICNIGLYILDDLDVIRCKHVN